MRYRQMRWAVITVGMIIIAVSALFAAIEA
jgi:hypothetical protein